MRATLWRLPSSHPIPCAPAGPRSPGGRRSPTAPGTCCSRVAVVLFFVALAVGFSGTMATLVVAALVAACVLLAPSIILGYAVKAAEREDRERGW